MQNNIGYYTSNDIIDLNIQLTVDDIYIGKIMEYTSFSTDYRDRGVSREYSFVKNAFLVKLNWFRTNHPSISLYIELEKLKSLLKQLEDSHGKFLIPRKAIMFDMPTVVGDVYVDSNSIKKYNYRQGVATGISSKQNQKVKTLVKEINQKGE